MAFLTMISKAQKSLIKRAQREAGLTDQEYREALEIVSGCDSSKDPAMTDGHVDQVLSYFEAIYWRRVDSGELVPSCKSNAPFRQRGYWAQKNTKFETSRDRYNGRNLNREITELEMELRRLGYGSEYCAAIRDKIGGFDTVARHRYRCALQRTLRSKSKSLA